MKLRYLKSRLFGPVDDMGGGGGAPVADAALVAVEPAPAAPVAQVEAAPAAPASDQPKDMLEAINRHFERDEAGRFKAKQEADAAAALGKPVAAKPAAPVEPEDPTVMPEGLGVKAQERFQKLAGTVKEVSAERDQARQEVAQVRDYLQQHKVSPQQFEQAIGVLGMLNTGDLEGALKVLDQQRQQIALALGKPLPGVDGLAGFPDLRQKVDALAIDEESAYETARLRQQQQIVQQQRQQGMQAQQSQEAFQRAQMDVDALCKQLAASDIDYPVIEGQLAQDLPEILRDVPMASWTRVVKAQYDMLKRAAATFRRPAPGAINTDSNPLRATGGGSPQQRPRDAYEAMWGKPAPAGM